MSPVMLKGRSCELILFGHSYFLQNSSYPSRSIFLVLAPSFSSHPHPFQLYYSLWLVIFWYFISYVYNISGLTSIKPNIYASPSIATMRYSPAFADIILSYYFLGAYPISWSQKFEMNSLHIKEYSWKAHLDRFAL